MPLDERGTVEYLRVRLIGHAANYGMANAMEPSLTRNQGEDAIVALEAAIIAYEVMLKLGVGPEDVEGEHLRTAKHSLRVLRSLYGPRIEIHT